MSSGDAPARPVLSIVVAGPSAAHPHTACLRALKPQAGDGVEAILVTERSTGEQRRSWLRELVHPGASVSELWAKGLSEASGAIIALTSSTLVPGPDWVERTIELHHDGVAVVGGPIEPGTGMGLVDWALFFCRYSPYLRPISERTSIEVPADNASYLREVLVQYHELYESAFLEPFVHAAMRADGHEVRMTAERVVHTLPGAQGVDFCRQRFRHGRAHGERWSVDQSRGRILRAGLTAPLVPVVMTARVVSAVMAKRRHRGWCTLAMPLVFAFYCCWAAGELMGRLGAARRWRRA